MKNVKSKRKSLRRQWSVDVPSSIQKKFREVTAARRSRSFDEEVYKEKLLDDKEYKGEGNNKCKGSFDNFGQADSELPHSSCSSGSSPWYSFDDDNEDTEREINETQPGLNRPDIDDIQIDIKSSENLSPAKRTKDIVGLSTINELVPRSPIKRTSPAADINKDKTGNDVPKKFAKNEEIATGEEEPEIGERYRRYAICEEMEKYIIVDHKGLSLRKYRETLIRHRVLKELCLL
ncbi:uncharacterized protein LOC114527646 [Dendronephthya gigantea]|uniref:uncharacterized protein LOC114527646 n=1 Tax=Dendronephthya gigantea TaxID=151771 RepID=UPI0010694295|nr:uncharacterized protein LOC114527646 [Dendronephthya gigantea]